jgi:hypothetical protein
MKYICVCVCVGGGGGVYNEGEQCFKYTNGLVVTSEHLYFDLFVSNLFILNASDSDFIALSDWITC